MDRYERVIFRSRDYSVDDIQKKLIAQLKEEKFNVISLPMRHARTLGGGFHCVTCDLERD